ncbi:isoprenyl transferase [Folsomia candida]|uniref:isoprenyl transferase n=1 Tax=Folsomia candida TaxID=158441 RepID=UPI0016051969|nr:isoprenyl transferase [Folsomia candida]
MPPKELSCLETLGISIAKIGRIPEHIAIIMDGNRRYAKNQGLTVAQGHEAGSYILKNLSIWGKALGCKEFTVYAFSNENFKRTKAEVDDLMDLFMNECANLLHEVDAGINKNTCIQIVGNWENLPAKLRHRMANLMHKTRHLKPFLLKLAIAYTGREGILRSLNALPLNKDPDEKTHLHSEQCNEYLIHQSQYLVDMRPIDMLIRTGGDCRLSDFMLWESSQSYIHFINETWPEFTLWKLIHAILMYQVHARKFPNLIPPRLNTEEKPNNILEKSRNERWNRIKRLAERDTPVGKIQTVIHTPNKFLQAVKNILTF